MSEVLDYTAIAEGGMDALRGKLYAYAGEVEGWEKATPILAAYLEAEFRKHIAELEALVRRLRKAAIRDDHCFLCNVDLVLGIFRYPHAQECYFSLTLEQAEGEEP